MAAVSTKGNGDLKQSGIFKLMDILKDHLDVMEERDAAVEKVISHAETADDLRNAKTNAILVEKELLNSIMQDIGEMNDFLNNIILIENLFNKLYAPYKAKQEQTREKYAKSIQKFDKGASKQSKKVVLSEASSFVTLMFGASNALAQFQKWLDEKVMKQCKKEGIKMKEDRPKAKLKGMDRAFYKAFYVYGKDDDEGYQRMTDLVRVSLVFDTFEDLYKCFDVLDILSEQTLGGLLRVKDRFHPQTVPFGYRDLLINVMCPRSKIVAEIQLHHKLFYKHKKISHKMYKRARLFERPEGNLAYNYADTFLRPKLGTQKVYEVTKGDTADDDDAKGNESDEEVDFRTLLSKWGFGKFVDVFEENGYEDPSFWSEIPEEELVNDLGFKKGHIRRWNMQIEKFKNRSALKEQRKEQSEQQEGKEDDVQNESAATDRAEWGLSRHDGYLVQGSDIEVANMSIKAAKGYAMTLPKCTGFSYKSGSDPTTIWFKHTLTSVYGGKSSGFVTYLVGSRLSKHHGYLVQGSDIEVKQMTIRQAKKYALELPKCTGCCFKPTGKQFDDDEETTVWFKHTITEVCAPQSGWITYLVE